MSAFKVTELKAGMSFSENVYIGSDNFFLGANLPIGKHDLDRLNKWSISEVQSKGVIQLPAEDDETLSPLITKKVVVNEKIEKISKAHKKVAAEYVSFSELYRSLMKAVEHSYDTIPTEKPFDYALIRQEITKLVDLMGEVPNIFIHIYGVPEVQKFIYRHSISTTIFSILLGRTLDYSRPKLIDLGISALLADIGMALVPVFILEKMGKLTTEEYQEVKKHTLLGYRLLTQKAKMKNSMAIVALQHHENFNGSGYPRQMKGAEIEESSRIISLADHFSAQIHNRPYRKKLLPYKALNNALSIDLLKLDPVLLRKFVGRLSIYPIGSIVELSDKRLGLIIESNPEKPLRPIIKVIRDEKLKRLTDFNLIDLNEMKTIYIIKAIDPSNLGITIEDEI